MVQITNKFSGVCECGARVPAGAGRAIKTAAGKWAVRCGCDRRPISAGRWAAYRDADRWVIGRRDWQAGTAMTHGVAEAYSPAEAREAVAVAAAMSDAQAEAAKRVFWTDGRFEGACDEGRYGPAW